MIPFLPIPFKLVECCINKAPYAEKYCFHLNTWKGSLFLLRAYEPSAEGIRLRGKPKQAQARLTAEHRCTYHAQRCCNSTSPACAEGTEEFEFDDAGPWR